MQSGFVIKLRDYSVYGLSQWLAGPIPRMIPDTEFLSKILHDSRITEKQDFSWCQLCRLWKQPSVLPVTTKLASWDFSEEWGAFSWVWVVFGGLEILPLFSFINHLRAVFNTCIVLYWSCMHGDMAVSFSLYLDWEFPDLVSINKKPYKIYVK